MTTSWIRDRENDRWRALLAVVSAVLVAWGVVALRDGDWAWSVFLAILLVELLRRILTGVLVNDDAVTLISGPWVRHARLDEIEAVEVARPSRRSVFVRLWVDGKRYNVIDVWTWKSPVAARQLALRLTADLQRRGAAAGMYDAIEDEWPVTPASPTMR